MAIERNVIVLADTEEQMQGIIRGIEALDKENKIGIMHGMHGLSEVDEITMILAEVAGAVIIHSFSITPKEHPQGKALKYFPLAVPNTTREQVIAYIKVEYPNLIEDILKV